MIDQTTALVALLVAVAAIFSFLNGAKDGANALATIITSRAVGPVTAVWMVGLSELLGPFIFGIAVAQTIGSGVVDPGSITLTAVVAALVSASLWNMLTWKWGIPTSSSHALVGGLIGSVVTSQRFDLSRLQMPGLIKIGAGLFLAPIVSLVAAYIVMRIAQLLLRGASPSVGWFFKRGQLVTTLALALSHGANDAPKAMGILTLGLVAAGTLPEFQVPLWVKLLAVTAVAAGTVLGGWRMVRTIGTRFYRVRTLHAFNSQLTAASLVIGASLLGSPVSTSQVVSSAIAGAGAADRLTKVRWGVMQEIMTGWLLTIPATVVAGGLTYLLLHSLLGA